MPKVVIPVDHTDSTISRLVAKTVMEQLIYHTEMPHVHDIVYVERGGIAAQAQSNAPGEALKLEVDNHLHVTYRERYDEAHYDMSKYQQEYPLIFKASKLGINIAPMHTRMQMEIEVEYISKSYNDLTLWHNALQRRLLNATASHLHDIQYNYTIPEPVLAYINQVFIAQEAVAGYGETLTEFLKSHFAVNGLVARHNLNDTKQTLAMNVKNTNCVGVFTQLPDIQETQKDPPLSKVTFTYTLTYDRVTALLLKYQKYVHNQLLDLVFIAPYGDRRLHQAEGLGYRTFSGAVNTVTEKTTYAGLDYPLDDQDIADGWRPEVTPMGCFVRNLIPIQLGLPDVRTLLTLADLSVFGFPEWLITLMGRFPDKLTDLYRWPVHFELYEVSDIVNRVDIHVDANGVILADTDLNPRNRYYLRIMVLTYLFRVDFSALQTEPATLLQLFQWINPAVTMTTLGDGSYVTWNEVWRIINFINRSDYRLITTKTVQSTTLRIRRQ